MKKEKGFTLIEVMSVVVILGIIMLIAVPAVSENILSTRKSAYADDIIAYVDSVELNFLQRTYGSFPEEGEILVVPIEDITLERNNTKESPFGSLMLDYCYVVIVPRNLKGSVNGKEYDYYASFLDNSGNGLSNVFRSELNGSHIEILSQKHMAYSQIRSGAAFEYNGQNYTIASDRENALLLSMY